MNKITAFLHFYKASRNAFDPIGSMTAMITANEEIAIIQYFDRQEVSPDNPSGQCGEANIDIPISLVMMQLEERGYEFAGANVW